MALLRLGEVEAPDDPACLGGVVVLDRRLQPFAQRLRLAELAAEPAEQADLCCAAYRLKAQCCSLRSTRNPFRS